MIRNINIFPFFAKIAHTMQLALQKFLNNGVFKLGMDEKEKEKPRLKLNFFERIFV